MSLPFLPGHTIDTIPHSSKRYNKRHMFDISSGIRTGVNPSVSVREQKTFPLNDPLVVPAMATDYKQAVSNRFVPENTMSRLPAWVAYDRKVLRFFGYFKEAVQSSSTETWRIRKCVLYFYLEDDSIHIAEPKVENSGIPQGVFIKRHCIPKNNNEYMTISDLFIGAELAIYGRVFRLINCDDFTRAFYASRGVQLLPAERYPVDTFTLKHTYRPHTHHKLMNPLKKFMEANLGKPMNQAIEATQQFLRNDGKVLRFYCTWSHDAMYGERRPYIIHYFLADDTVEVMEVATPNAGRDAFPCLLKRQKLPKNWDDSVQTIPRIGMRNDQKIEFYTEADFKVGGIVDVYGRKLFICGCDKFTQEFYMENFNMTPQDFPRLQMDDPVPAVPLMAPPKYNGFGSEEDSLGSFLYLMPKVPKRNFKKLMENDGINLRFQAKLVNPSPEDQERIFIITYYMSDDTLGIYEKFQRNSGFIGGKFLERCRVKNPDSREYYKAADFRIGNRLNINTNIFDLVMCDDFTSNFMTNNRQIFDEGLTREEKSARAGTASPGAAARQQQQQQNTQAMMQSSQQMQQSMQNTQPMAQSQQQQQMQQSMQNTRPMAQSMQATQPMAQSMQATQPMAQSQNQQYQQYMQQMQQQQQMQKQMEQRPAPQGGQQIRF